LILLDSTVIVGFLDALVRDLLPVDRDVAGRARTRWSVVRFALHYGNGICPFSALFETRA
jgi:hypothetical protein